MRARELRALLVVVAAGAAGMAFAQPGGRSGTGVRKAPAAVNAALDDQLQVVDQTERLLVEKIAARERRLQTRVRAAYRALRATSPAPPWVDDGGAARRSRQRLGIRRVLRREVRELALVRAELAQVQKRRAQVVRARERADQLVEIAPGSLHNPVAYSRVLAPFGTYRHAASNAQLARRGVVLSSQVGRNVRAVAAGRVRHVGEIAGLGLCALVEHGDFWSLSGPLAEVQKEPGARVERAEILGESRSEQVYLEIRMATGEAGIPVDPVPLIGW